MTTPIRRGHPDWFRTVAGTVVEVINISGNQVALQQSHGVFYVGNLPYIWVSASVDVNGLRIRFEWLDDDPLGTLVAANYVDGLGGNTIDGSLPVLGPFVEIITEVSAVPTLRSVNVWQSLSQGQEGFGTSANHLISVDGANVVAGATRIDNVTRVHWGWGHWTSVFDNGVDTLSRLYSVSYTGTLTLLDVMGAGISNDSRLILLPMSPVRMSSFNADASDRLLYASVLYHTGPT